MAKKSSVEKQRKRQKLVDKYWEKRVVLKSKILNPDLDHEEKLQAIDDLNRLPKNSSVIRLRNRCQLTGRSRGFLRKFNVSRICFRDMANRGLVPGVFKASW